MGFDLYGMKPTIRKEMPEMLHAVENATDEVPLWDKWDKSERIEYGRQVRIYERENPGVYFHNTIHFWHPLWNYVFVTCSDIIDEDDFIRGNTNDSYEIDSSKAKKIAGRLYKMLATEEVNDDIAAVLKEVKKEGNEEIPFNRENVEQFALFCKESGGFKIC